MKKTLLTIAALALLISACGPSEKEKEQMQEKNEAMVDERVNEIIKSLDKSAEEVIVKDSLTTDTVTMDSAM